MAGSARSGALVSSTVEPVATRIVIHLAFGLAIANVFLRGHSTFAGTAVALVIAVVTYVATSLAFHTWGGPAIDRKEKS
jgi:hypothetical protein